MYPTMPLATKGGRRKRRVRKRGGALWSGLDNIPSYAPQASPARKFKGLDGTPFLPQRAFKRPVLGFGLMVPVRRPRRR